MKKGFIIDPADNVAIVLDETFAGDALDIQGRVVTARESISALHKIALEDIPEGGQVIKFGEAIGFAREAIHAGDWVHAHNLYC